MVSGSPCMCIRQMGRPVSAAASIAPSRLSARTSLIRPTPAAAPASITFGVLVSNEISTSKRPWMHAIAPRTRSISSCSETARAPGRVDSPPISKNEAPATTMDSAAPQRASTLRPELLKRAPPSENESGVTLRMPMTKGRSRENSRPGHTSCVGPPPGVVIISVD